MLRGVKCMADRSRMNREVHVRICEGLGVKFPRATRLKGRIIIIRAIASFTVIGIQKDLTAVKSSIVQGN
jgi:hypothetical protein